MTIEEKKVKIREWYYDKNHVPHKFSFCQELAKHYVSVGFKLISPWTLYRNTFTYGGVTIPEYKIDTTYEFTKQFKSNIDSEAETKTESSKVDVNA